MAYLLKPTLGGFPRLHMRKLNNRTPRCPQLTYMGGPKNFADSCCAASTPRCPTGGDKGQRSSNQQSGVQIVAGHLTVSLSNTIFTVDKSSDSYERFKGSLHEFHLSPVRSQFSDSIFAPSSPSPVQGFGRFSERQLGCIRMTWKPSQKKKKKQYSKSPHRSSNITEKWGWWDPQVQKVGSFFSANYPNAGMPQ